MSGDRGPPSTTNAEKNRNLVLRLLTAIIGIPIVLVLLTLGGWWFAGLASLCCLFGALELSHMALGSHPLRFLAGAAALLMPLFLEAPALRGGVQWLWIGLLVAALSWRLLMSRPVETAGCDVMSTVFAAMYGSLLGYLVLDRDIGPAHSWMGAGWVVLVLCLTWMSDTGAYFAGRFFGKKKLYPSISPSKTWAGAWGGALASVLGAVVAHFLALPDLGWGDCVVVGLLAGVLGPIGDLAESMLKRSFSVKDSGHLFPGHGGMLDRADSLAFNALVVYGWHYLTH